MAISKKIRELIYLKCDKHCGYCGKELVTIKEMQVDHMKPQWMFKENDLNKDNFNNLLPTCRRCNHYKRGSTVEQFRKDMITLHERLMKIYIFNVALDFKLFEIKQFDGVFYFER